MSGQRTQWNEATRVQMPALVHLTRIGFTYFGKITEDKAGTVYDPDTNILIEVFKSQFAKLNPERAGEAEAMLRIIRQELDNDDIGESFYKRLKAVSPVRLIDFEHPENNTFHCSAEFTCKRDEDEFRPDITLFVNGLPLVFIEVKKPNNIGGMVAEAERMNKLRFPNKKFRRFINITQLMIFSNNMEYDAMGGIVPIQGVFYCTGSKKGSPFNCFREENPLNLDVAPYNRDFPYKDIDPEVEKQILSDFNNQVIHTSPEYQTNLQTTTPTNRVLTSMCSPDRLLYDYKAQQTGFVQPYADSPMDNEQVGEEVYISMINKAEKYCWFMTPYLIITDEMTHALCLAAKRGVDVRIITPGIPDKKFIYNITRSFYHGLVKHGVRVYEWTPGFCHAKMSVADDCMATCGTINLDYRSLYHHFENGCFMADCQAVVEIKNDLIRTMGECRDVTDQYQTGRSAYLRLGQLFMRLFAGLL